MHVRILLSLLSGRPISIKDIHINPQDYNEQVGLRDYEECLLKLVERLTNGTRIEINETGTSVLFIPGLLSGLPSTMPVLYHECPPSRSMSYYIEIIIWLICLVRNQPVNITLTGGLTCSSEKFGDASVDLVRVGLLPLLKHFNIAEELEIKIVKRGFPPLGKGVVEIVSQRSIQQPPKNLPTLHLLDPTRVHRIRGIAYSARVNNTITTRLATSARSVLNQFIRDTYIYSDTAKGAGGPDGTSPGWGICLVAETVNGCLYTSEVGSDMVEGIEDAGVAVARMLLEEISYGGCVDRYAARWMLMGMYLGQSDFGRVRFSSKCLQDEGFVYMVRDGKTFFELEGRFKPSEATETTAESVVAIMRGSNWVNPGRKTT